MHRGPTGQYKVTSAGGERVRAFVPDPLPPDPPLELTHERQRLVERATLALGRLDSVTLLLPDPDIFLYAYVRRRGRGLLPDRGNPIVARPVAAIRAGRCARRTAGRRGGGFQLRRRAPSRARPAAARIPLSNRLIREMHARLLERGRGSGKSPGQFRRTQNWIGGTRPGNAHFVPPPPEDVESCMAAMEQFLHDTTSPYSALVRAALAHVQFEFIHPFLDGNGRIGRLLIAFILHHEGVLSQPLLYLSLYFKQHRAEYYRLLDQVRFEGDWEAWVDFFLEGVGQTAAGAVETAGRLVALFGNDRRRAQGLGRIAATTLRVFDALCQRPLATLNQVCQRPGSRSRAQPRGWRRWQRLGIARELTGQRRNRIFAYDEYLSILNEGMEPI